MEHQEHQPPQFYFSHTDVNGATNTVSFETEYWTEALEQFVLFLRGSGFILYNNSIAINADEHYIDYSRPWNFTEFSEVAYDEGIQ